MKPSIVCGIEIEAEVKGIRLDKVDNYHADHMSFDEYNWFGNQNFVVERDGSLNVTSWGAGRSYTAEFVSVPFEIDEWQIVLENFKSGFKDKKLNDVLNFNDTCGAHIHIGVLNVEKPAKTKIQFRKNLNFVFDGANILFKDGVSFNLMKKISTKVMTKVKKEFPAIYDAWLARYTRYHARELTEADYVQMMMQQLPADKYREWNLGLRNRIEYRSFHLYGIKTWEDFFKIYSILFDAIKSEIEAECAGTEPFSQEFEFQFQMPSNTKPKKARRRFPIGLAEKEKDASFVIPIGSSAKLRGAEDEIQEM